MRTLRTSNIRKLLLLPVEHEGMLLFRRNPPFTGIAHCVAPLDDHQRYLVVLKEFLDAAHLHLMPPCEGGYRQRPRRQAPPIENGSRSMRRAGNEHIERQ